jgi:arylsulfatase A-like enzyme
MRNRYIESAARALLFAFAFVFLEWLFQATKPSFIGTWPLPVRISALFAGAIPFLAAALGVHLVACALAWFCSRAGRERLAAWLLRLAPALAVAATVLMLVDNFTYTVFAWGVVRTTAATAWLYWLLLVVVIVLCVRRAPADRRWRVPLAGLLLLASAASLAWSLHSGPGFIDPDYRSASDGRLPNIILFAADGVNADFMSAYGYERKTTPNLDRYLDRALVADNAFTNSAWTTGSLTSMLTGKYATTTKVLYPPYTLQGEDAFQSLPRILRGLGYRNLQETVRYYADAPDLGMEEAFDQVNGRPVASSRPDRYSLALQHPAKFAGNTFERLSGRVLQLARVRQMEDPFAQVAQGDGHAATRARDTTDDIRMQRVADFIRTSRQPFFIHVHLLGTHCCSYHPRQQVFSAGAGASKKAREEAGLANAILDADRRFGAMMDLLQERGLLDDTIVVVTSDHDTHWEVRARVPMVFLFPNGEHAGHVGGNTQLLDVAPTLLDYLGVKAPSWMEGESLLEGGFERTRPIFSIHRMQLARFRNEDNEMLGKVETVGPPTYGLRTAAMVACQRWYIMHLDDSRVVSGDMDRYRDKCTPDELPSDKQAGEMISAHLHDRGFEF